MTTPSLPANIPYSLVQTPAALRKAVEHLQGFSSLALDMEMENHFHHYGLHVALIQLSAPDRENFIVDPLAIADLRLLGDLLMRPSLELILHDAEFDHRTARAIYGWSFRRVFDTKIAAMFCGIRQFGLASLIRQFFDMHVDKRFQKTDWLKRPLPENALRYAARDTASLHALKAILEERLTTLGRLEWFHEECRVRAEQMDQTPPPVPAHFRAKQSHYLTPRQLAVLAALMRVRDALARRLDKPVHFVARDEILMDWARRPALDEAVIRATRSIHPQVYRPPHLGQWIEAFNAGLAAAEEIHPSTQRRRRPFRPGSDKRLKAMQNWRRALALELDLEPHLLLSNDILNVCASQDSATLPPELASELRDWQKTVVWPRFLEQFDTFRKN